MANQMRALHLFCWHLILFSCFSIQLAFLPCFGKESSNADDETDDLRHKTSLGYVEHRIGRYTYVPLCTDKELQWARAFEIKKDGRRVFSYFPEHPTVGSCWIEEAVSGKSKLALAEKFRQRQIEDYVGRSDARLNLDKDITGDGIPDLIVGSWTGGAHCCFDYRIFSLGPKFRLFGIINGLDSHFSFKDLDGDGACEAIGYDCNFRYWHECFAYSPAPLVILSLKNGKIELAKAMMKQNRLSEKDFESLAKPLEFQMIVNPSKLAKVPPRSVFINSKLWSAMLNLIYAGNGAQAWQLFDKVWPATYQGYWGNSSAEDGGVSECIDLPSGISNSRIDRAEFVRDFKKQLSASQYYPGLKQLNGW